MNKSIKAYKPAKTWYKSLWAVIIIAIVALVAFANWLLPGGLIR